MGNIINNNENINNVISFTVHTKQKQLNIEQIPCQIYVNTK